MADGRDNDSDDRIPWLNAVRFHLDIVKRAEESFFSLPIGVRNADRWSALTGFDPESLAGPWRVQRSSIESSPFLRLALEQRHETLFMGGPGYLGRTRKDSGGYADALQPLLYREVILVEKSDAVEIHPEKGRWELSPLVYQSLMRQEIDTEDLETTLGALIEGAELRLEEEGESLPSLHAWIWDFLERREVAITSIKGSGDVPTDLAGWCLFAPSQSVSTFNQYLHRDFTRLEQRLQDDPTDVGGLALIDLDARTKKTKPKPNGSKTPELRALVPLNEAQRAAVEQILSGAPVTVVSGPPGTGKSQVIVSALLNAWALGKTVLFASQNNKAVDVVIERVKKFEQDFPILVRAGARRNSNITAVLKDVQGYAAQTARGVNTATEDSALRAKLTTIREQLDTKLPQRISDARTAAFRAFAEHQGVRAQIEETDVGLRSMLDTIGAADLTLAVAQAALESDRQWIQRLHECFAQIAIDSSQRREYERQVDSVRRRCNDALASVGSTTTGSDWAWLTDEAAINTTLIWARNFESISAGQIDEQLAVPDWSDTYDRWRSSDDASRWAAKARVTSEQIRDVVKENVEKLRTAQDIHREVDLVLEELKARRIPAEITIEASIVESWRKTYTLLKADAASGGLPWSPQARRLRALRRLERSLAGPLSIAMREIGGLGEETRDQLAEVVDVLSAWLGGPQEKHRHLVRLERDIKAAFDDVSTDLDRLGHEKRSWTIEDTDAWLSTAAQLDRSADIADSASSAWVQRTTRQRVQNELRASTRDLTRIFSDSPVAERWAGTVGRDFAEAARRLIDEPTAETFSDLRRRQIRGELKSLTDAWRVASEAAKELDRLTESIAALAKPDERLRAWRSGRPESTLLDLSEEDPDPVALDEQLRRAEVVLERWQVHEHTTLPELQERADETLRFAVRMLRQAASTLSEADSAVDLSLIDAITDEREQEWPQEELAELFDAYQVSRLEATAAGLELQLQSIAFAGAKAAWVERLNKDHKAYSAIESLDRALRRSLKLEQSSHTDFRDALRLVPIWTTTALSAQSIPLEPGLFDVVIIDEASQCTLTNVLPLIYRAKSLAVIGDLNQLNPIPNIRINEERALALKHDVGSHLDIIGHDGNDVYQSAVQSLPRTSRDVTMLVEHFRSHPLIIGFSNRAVYQQKLELMKEPSSSRLPVASGVHVEDVLGSARRTKSWLNELEAERVAEIVAGLRGTSKARNLSIGVVTPFRSQKELIRDLLDKRGVDGGVLVDTAHGFQGDERDVMVFSPVVAPGIEDGSATWVGNPPNLVNVALTRAREALFVVANLDYCATVPGILSDLADYCRTIQLLRESSPAELELFSWLVLRGHSPEVHPVIGDTEVDFVLRTETGVRVAIEVDGRTFHKDRPAQDRARDAFLQGQGFSVIRIPAREVAETPFDVLHRIESALLSN